MLGRVRHRLVLSGGWHRLMLGMEWHRLVLGMSRHVLVWGMRRHGLVWGRHNCLCRCRTVAQNRCLYTIHCCGGRSDKSTWRTRLAL